MNRLRTLLLLLVFVGLTSVNSCGGPTDGVVAYNAGDYQNALNLLSSSMKNYAAKTPSFSVSTSSTVTLEQAARDATVDYFTNFEAYCGSYFGLSQVREGCQWIVTGLRPINFTVNGSRTATVLDPHTGTFWESQAKSLRTWWEVFKCDQISL